MSFFALLLLASPLLILTLLYIHHLLVTSRYWSKRNVPHLKPIFLVGNLIQANFFDSLVLLIKKMHLENSREKFLGFWLLRSPVLLINDLDLIRRVFIKDFDLFHNRVTFDNSKIDPLSGHLFFLSGKPWRNLRVKLTPTFTSGKMKLMFPTMMDCGHQLLDRLNSNSSDREVIEVKDLMARYTTDVISSCAFGIETNSMKNPDSVFRKYGIRIVTPSYRSIIFNTLQNSFPWLIKLIRFRVIPKDISDFFINTVRETIAYRTKNNATRNDFIQILIQLMNRGKLEDADRKHQNGDAPGVVDDYTFTELEAAAQCFVFFLAGFETSSTALTYGLYELALNPDIQKRLQDEIDRVLGDGDVTYDKMSEMQYLDMVVSEILRKYPSLGILTRTNAKDYRIPETDVIIPKNSRLFIPALGIHHNPQYYPNPEKFDPERFSPEVKKNRDPMTYLPFGDGPRSCIGSRFGLMQIKIGLISILRKTTVEICEKTPIPIKVELRSIFLVPKGGLPLAFKKRI